MGSPHDNEAEATQPTPRLPTAIGAPLSSNSRWGRMGFLTLLGVIAALLIFLPPPLRDIILRPCTFHSLVGLPCAMCGGTRALFAILHGDFVYAWSLNPAAVLLIAATAIVCTIVFIEVAVGRRVCPYIAPRIRTAFGIGFCIALVAWTVFHAWSACVHHNEDLVDFHHPVVRWLTKQ